ncbi:hypothetical protein A2X44_03485 [candidate division CPR3 bacterium GWF2_35_18]|uniref:Type IV secretory pathway VirB4 component-like protein n=1 Tax=candidate division CPR3 bacterium GW2011_GWF2_35_18 TaxID=1618350 RepID=A0A0G0BJ94_UNCC3|nr:MAG: Type IV secretory pathway VirB4 component-like protein [candidate division CPR3 bacterium GW2011_GWF2_35_18]KKP85848.1 MAG: Type IV secretory pathway VirB4 component-like protein [candidate division CPR3 bacterium GW2011_GWE2_35_7]OGB63042.1 MAG: hypothetical protein A2X44_03485 [candidate division CPR3 bacterium GWF2_35_18]OGB63934.1 MAG: hypothetical protein A2250_02720 [candidate division CPR3 bacterium RIFOXYA2_FULL_35_13]OGB80067.1 MAG: hypothetical protein A2011_01765 [candidate d
MSLFDSVQNLIFKDGNSKVKAEVAETDSEILKTAKGIVNIKDIIAPSAVEIDFNHVRIGTKYFRTLFMSGYPRYVGANWLAPLVNFPESLDVSMFYYPVETRGVVNKLQRKIAEMQSEITTELSAGKIVNPDVKLAVQDAQMLQDSLVAGEEKFFQFALYVSIPAASLEELDLITKKVESILGAALLLSKKATLRMNVGFIATTPSFTDNLQVYRNMDTTSIATTFPFTSSDLTANEGVMFGVNEHNGSLVIFDRFKMENANMVVFAKSGGGKSYMVKLEALRSLMLGTEIIIVDPENEYKPLCEAIGGEFIDFSFNSNNKINPFDLSQVYEEGSNELGLKILNLHGLFKTMMGELTPTEEAILDRALVLTYKSKGITPEPKTQKNEPPRMEDLYKILQGMEEKEATVLSERIEKYIKGSAVGIFNENSNIDIRNTFTVFGIRDLEQSLRPIAMHIILDFIWTKVRRDRKKRILIVDEAWHLMQHPDSAYFMYSIAKRARKYYLGMTTITQDVEDFLGTDYGKAIVTNSSIQMLMRQSPAAVDRLTEVFYLSEAEKRLLLATNVGEGVFFAGESHVAIQVIASNEEHKLITTNPEELMSMEKQAKQDAEKAVERNVGAF